MRSRHIGERETASSGVPDGPEGRLGFGLWCAARAVMREVDAAIRPLGLTHSQLIVLLRVDRIARTGGEPRARDIVRADRMDENQVSQVVRRLEEAGLLSRGRAETNGRARTLALTPAGEAARAAGLKRLDEVEARIVAERLGQRDAARLIALAAKVDAR